MSSSNAPAYLTEYLNEIAKKERFIQYTISFEAGSTHDESFVGIMIAATIKGKQMVDLQDEKELNLMCKLLPHNKDRREIFNSTMLFEREVYVYNEILPMFEKFQYEKDISVNDGFFMYPKCYMAVADADKDHYFIVMENLETSGYEIWDKMKPVDFDTSSILLASLGRLHGLSFAIRDQMPQFFQKLAKLQNFLIGLSQSPNLVRIMTGGIDKAIETLTDEDDIYLMKHIKDNFKAILEKLLLGNAAGKFAILNHGDCWNNNFCFLSDENKKPYKICFFDWQLSAVNSPALDFSYYLMTSTTKELRTHYEKLLEVYYNSFSTIVTKLGSDPSTLFPFEELKNQMQQFGIFGVVMAPILLQVIVSDPKNILDMDSIDKYTKVSALAVLDNTSKITYRQRISDVLQDANKFGWFDF